MTPEQEANITRGARWIAAAIIVAGLIGAGAMFVVYYNILENRAAIQAIDRGEPPTQWQSWVEQQLQQLWHNQPLPTPTWMMDFPDNEDDNGT